MTKRNKDRIKKLQEEVVDRKLEILRDDFFIELVREQFIKDWEDLFLNDNVINELYEKMDNIIKNEKPYDKRKTRHNDDSDDGEINEGETTEKG